MKVCPLCKRMIMKETFFEFYCDPDSWYLEKIGSAIHFKKITGCGYKSKIIRQTTA